jgi:hypothetical protein
LFTLQLARVAYTIFLLAYIITGLGYRFDKFHPKYDPAGYEGWGICLNGV